MTTDNFDQTLQAFRCRSPFRPFTVVLHSGRQFEVDQLGALVQRHGVAIFLGPGGIPVIFDHEGVEHFTGDMANRPPSQRYTSDLLRTGHFGQPRGIVDFRDRPFSLVPIPDGTASPRRLN